MKKILFVSSEAHPLIKTGGLADVSGSLPKALAQASQDIRLVIPNYKNLKVHGEVHYLCTLRVDNRDVSILETRLPASNVIVWLVDYAPFFALPGTNPYLDEQGSAWTNNAERFALFSRVAVEIAMNRVNFNWKADVVHCNDWQTGLVSALLSLESYRPATVFTIHNMAYQGLFPSSQYYSLSLPSQLWHPDGLEFHGMLSLIKGGVVYADRITTVSPTYALEIQTPGFGYGLDGLLRYKQDVLSGILNGIDIEQWNPQTDTAIAQCYGINTLEQKQVNKTALQEKLSLPVNPQLPVFGLISRLVEQKGIDLILECLPEMVAMPMQFILLGSGEASFEQRLQNFAHLYPEKIAVTFGYDENLAHLIEAGADIFLMPSRFEPCGLNQLYSQRYGTIPIVRETGGLADSIEDALPESLANNTATGISFHQASPGALMEAIKRAMILFDNKEIWRGLQYNSMSKDFSWRNSAMQYLALYDEI
jgi:starch synthase